MTDAEMLRKIIERARAIQNIYGDAKRMESMRIGRVSRENYIKVALAFVEEVSKMNTQDDGN